MKDDAWAQYVILKLFDKLSSHKGPDSIILFARMDAINVKLFNCPSHFLIIDCIAFKFQYNYGCGKDALDICICYPSLIRLPKSLTFNSLIQSYFQNLLHNT